MFFIRFAHADQDVIIIIPQCGREGTEKSGPAKAYEAVSSNDGETKVQFRLMLSRNQNFKLLARYQKEKSPVHKK